MRKLYSDLKYSSLFDYCTRELGYSEGSAQRRIVACRMMKVMPEIEKKIESGALTLTNISQVNQFFKDEEAQKKAFIEIEGKSKKECEKKLFELSGKEVKKDEEKKRISKDKIQVAIVLSDETVALMEEVKRLIGKNLSPDELIQFVFKAAKEKVEKEKFKQTPNPKSPPPAKVNQRHIQNYIKRQVYQENQKCAQCGSNHRLNYDHSMPFALGGPSSIENIRLLCENCNQRGRIRASL